MTLKIPNPSRSYDARRQGVRFWGYDGALEVTFLVEQAALRSLQAGVGSNEAGMLGAFDHFREKILKAAARIYSGRRSNLYVLVPADF